MKGLLFSIITIMLAISITACTNQDLGTAGGAVVGGVAGNAITGGSTAGTIAGAVGGGYIGNRLSQ